MAMKCAVCGTWRPSAAKLADHVETEHRNAKMAAVLRKRARGRGQTKAGWKWRGGDVRGDVRGVDAKPGQFIKKPALHATVSRLGATVANGLLRELYAKKARLQGEIAQLEDAARAYEKAEREAKRLL